MFEALNSWYQNFDINQHISQLFNNDMFIALVVISVFGFLVFILRNIFRAIFKLLRSRFIVQFTISNKDIVFSYVMQTIQKHNLMRKSKRIRLGTLDSFDSSGDIFAYPGDGMHFMFYRGIPILINKTTKEAKTPRPPEEFTFYTFLWNKKKIYDLVKEGRKIMSYTNKNNILVFSITPSGSRIRYKHKRPFDSIFIDPDIEQQIIQRTDWFVNNELWFIEKGIPYHMGILLYGPPGTGKTSIAKAIATKFERPLSIINLPSMSGDTELRKSFDEVPSNSIVLMEDIDSFSIVKSRNDELKTNLASEKNSSDENKTAEHGPVNDSFEIDKLTLSGLLNVIDGVEANEGQILIFTTNDYKDLDSALMRRGRIDEKFYIGYQSRETISKMLKFLAPELTHKEHIAFLDDLVGRSPADVQGEIIQYLADRSFASNE